MGRSAADTGAPPDFSATDGTRSEQVFRQNGLKKRLTSMLEGRRWEVKRCTDLSAAGVPSTAAAPPGIGD